MTFITRNDNPHAQFGIIYRSRTHTSHIIRKTENKIVERVYRSVVLFIITTSSAELEIQMMQNTFMNEHLKQSGQMGN